MTVTVDRIEDGVAVLETDSEMFNIPLSSISFKITEGDILICETAGGTLHVISSDKAEKSARKKRIYKLFNKLFKENQK